MNVAQTDTSLDRLFAALADPTRRAIVERLSEGNATVGDVAALFPISGPAVSRHLKVLEEAGLVKRQVEAQKRRLSLNVSELQRVTGWVEAQRVFWHESVDRLEALLQQDSGSSGEVL